jgi:hypothetical protein
MKTLFAALSASFLLFLSVSFSFAASYPASCPVEAQTIVNAVGGCTAISPTKYGAIYSKCCSVQSSPAPKPVPPPAPLPAPPPMTTPIDQPLPVPAPSAADIVVIVLFIYVFPGLIGLWFSRWYLKRKNVSQKLINRIAWSNTITWIIPPLGIITGVATIVFSRAPNVPRRKYMTLAIIAIALAVIDVAFVLIITLNH